VVANGRNVFRRRLAMAYTMLKNKLAERSGAEHSLEMKALSFIRNRCEGLGFNDNKDGGKEPYAGKSIRANQIPYNMEKDIERLCMENAIARFLKTGKKEDAFDVYFCYLEMFVGDYEKTRKMIELLSEFEANGSRLLMKHRDHYSHSVYVFCLGLAIYESNNIYRRAYMEHYGLGDEHKSACHYLKYWGLASLFHDIGYPFELPFEQVCSYFEVGGDKREKRPFVAYHGLENYVKFNKLMQRRIGELYHLGTDRMISSTDDLFAYALYRKLGKIYYFSENEMLEFLRKKPTQPNEFGHFMDHAYFSATVLFKKMFEELNIELVKESIDSLTAIILHNSLYKFCIAYYKDPVSNIRFKPEYHPLAYMLMLCDELQCWDRTAYGRNSKLELHPMDCSFELKDNTIRATYIFDRAEREKIDHFNENPEERKLKAYDSYVLKEKITRDGQPNDETEVCRFQADIARIVDLDRIRLIVDTDIKGNDGKHSSYISESNFISLYDFAIILNGRWDEVDRWNNAKENGSLASYLKDKKVIERFAESFKGLSLEYKLSNINQAKAFAKYMNEIGCFYTDKSVDFEMVKSFTEDELIRIGHMEHQRWLQEHYDMGWIYGDPGKKERDLLRQHKDMIPNADGLTYVSAEAAAANYERLDKAEQDKDTDPMECMLALLRMYDGLRIYRLNWEVGK